MDTRGYELMHFRTYESWKNVNPINNIFFDEDANTCSRWDAFALPSYGYIYHVHLVPCQDFMPKERIIVMCDPFRMLSVLIESPESTLNLQVPPPQNNGEPGLFRVKELYMVSETNKLIAECIDGRLFSLSYSDLETENLGAVEIKNLWSMPQTGLSK